MDSPTSRLLLSHCTNLCYDCGWEEAHRYRQSCFARQISDVSYAIGEGSDLLFCLASTTADFVSVFVIIVTGLLVDGQASLWSHIMWSVGRISRDLHGLMRPTRLSCQLHWQQLLHFRATQDSFAMACANMCDTNFVKRCVFFYRTTGPLLPITQVLQVGDF